MPLVRIDVTAGRSPKELQAISQAVHEAIVDEYRIPERDYFHILTEHPAGQLVAQDAGLGFERQHVAGDRSHLPVDVACGRGQRRVGNRRNRQSESLRLR